MKNSACRLRFLSGLALAWGMFALVPPAFAQQVGLPAPRLLTVLPMGGQAGTTFDVTITGENVDDDSVTLLFSNPAITAVPKTGPEGTPVKGEFVVTVAPNASPEVCDARVLTDMGLSSSRAFSISNMKEATRKVDATSVETAFPVEVNSICNATAKSSNIDFYRFTAKSGERIFIECAARGIDSKLIPVLIVADAQGRDLKVDRRGGMIDFTAPTDGTYLIKVHDLTFQGGPYHFYRLALSALGKSDQPVQQPSTLAVNSSSIPSDSLAAALSAKEVEPNNKPPQAQKVTLPCDIAGQFFPAADVDTFEFTAKKGETWWAEVVSERRGLGTNPFALLQRVVIEDGQERLVDVAEFSDLPSPIKVSTNGYSYNGPPYNIGSADFLEKFVAPEDGTYRLQLRDLYGGTRSDPRNTYRLIIRRPTPDFSASAWALHMNLRNGDRHALSKPMALRPGTTMALEVVVIRKDGFNDEIELGMEDLPVGITATGLTIPAGVSVGTLLVTAAPDAAPAFGVAKIYGKARIDGEEQKRYIPLASMAWPIRDAKQEIPNPRLMADVPVSVAKFEGATVTVAPTEEKVWTVTAGETLTIPLKLTWRSEFSGAFKLKVFGKGFTGMKEFDVPLNGETVNAVLNLAELKTPPGEYTIAFYGGAVAKYRERMDRLKLAEQAVAAADQQVKAASEAVEAAKTQVAAAPDEQKAAATATATQADEALKAAQKTKTDADARLKAATATAAPKEIADIIVSTPIRISVQAAEKEAGK